MKISTANNHLNRLRAKLEDLYFFCRLSAWAHRELLAKLGELYADPALTRTPSWVKISLMDRSQALHRALYRPNLSGRELDRMIKAAGRGETPKPASYLRWALRVDGVETTSAEIIKRREAGDEQIWERVEGAHVWNHKPDQPFSEWERGGFGFSTRVFRDPEESP